MKPAPRRSAIPTPGRSRSSSTVQQVPVPVHDVEYMSRAFADAIKANDPALHRTSRTSDFSAASLSPQSTSFGQRPSSVASSSSTKQPERAKTPTTRPPSRQSDVFGRSSSRAGRAFEVGDNVRIESLGYEGTLRYMGTIDGKPGLWAGVELSGGFAGKGKNNGSVAGKQYFTCPPNCGVFVATTKLSPPTVGPGAVHRPSSVASSRGGRTTPSISGRTTPSTSMSFSTSSRMTPSASTSRMSTGRTTPSNGGRITPSYAGRATPGTTPAARARARVLAKPATIASPSASLTETLTAGSRASKYVSMTAKQLSSRDAASSTSTPGRRGLEPASPARSTLPSPSPGSRPLSSPTRPPASPFGTPKPSLGGRVSAGSSAMGRPSISTPRARIPSAVAMPPPASPVTRSVSQSDEASLSAWPSPRPESASSSRSMLNEERAQMQARIQALEYENERLRSASVPPDADQDQLNALRVEHEDAQSRASQLEAQLKAAAHTLEERATQIQELENARTEVLANLDQEKVQGESRLQTLEQQLEDSLLLANTLKETIAAKEAAEREDEGKLKAKQAEIVSLELRLKRTQTELDEDRIELGGQVDELRQAGQETIALYEERLSAADREKYELETRIASLEARARAATRSPSPTAAPKVASSATEIDNETLRDQVVHLQKKVAKLEDAIEDAHAASERDEAALAERMRRLKEKEEAAKKELNEGRKEVERMLKSEASARRRVEEIEEALQESTVALEDARAEVEGLRAELTNLDGLVAGNGESGDLYSRVAQVAKRASTDKTRFTDELAKLRDLVEEAQRRETAALEEVEKLRQALAAQSAEVEALKKKTNRDTALNNGIQSPQSPSVSKHDLSVAREEITGLKHIVQELQKESLAAAQRTKVLESENQLLLSEAEQLRQEVQILEENLDNSLTREENALDEGPPGDAASLQRLMKDQKAKFEMELEQLRKRLADSEMKSARVAHDLNKEISELEALIESKIYREDELEQELERTKDKLSRQRKSSKGSGEVVDSRRRTSVASSDVSDNEGVCEICEKPGHDIFTCSLLSAGGTADDRTSSDSELFCEDCESHGHVAADCPHSLDVF